MSSIAILHGRLWMAATPLFAEKAFLSESYFAAHVDDAKMARILEL